VVNVKGYQLLVCDASPVEILPIFRRTVLTPSSGLTNKRNKQPGSSKHQGSLCLLVVATAFPQIGMKFYRTTRHHSSYCKKLPFTLSCRQALQISVGRTLKINSIVACGHVMKSCPHRPAVSLFDLMEQRAAVYNFVRAHIFREINYFYKRGN
jgi:hypothetical protein